MSLAGFLSASIAGGQERWDKDRERRDRLAQQATENEQNNRRLGQGDRTIDQAGKRLDDDLQTSDVGRQLTQTQILRQQLQNDLDKETNPMKKAELQKRLSLMDEQVTGARAENAVNNNPDVISARQRVATMQPDAVAAGIGQTRASAAASMAGAAESGKRTELMGQTTERDEMDGLLQLAKATDALGAPTPAAQMAIAKLQEKYGMTMPVAPGIPSVGRDATATGSLGAVNPGLAALERILNKQ